jgi:GT2 family glycosyltransferase
MIRLSIIIPTYNRSDLLAVALEHIAKARVPGDMEVTVIVSDNNSAPHHQEANKAALLKYPDMKSVYLLATQQGRSHALNFALAHTEDEYVGFIDDDEKMDVAWFEVTAAYLRQGTVDFLGGPYKPDWESTPPDWLPVHVGAYRAVLGWIEQTNRAQPFTEFGGSICGGNCVVRRSALQEIGGFTTRIGRSKGNLMGGEDDELHHNLVTRGFYGIYDPALIIYHFIPNSRTICAGRSGPVRASVCACNGSRQNPSLPCSACRVTATGKPLLDYAVSCNASCRAHRTAKHAALPA